MWTRSLFLAHKASITLVSSPDTPKFFQVPPLLKPSPDAPKAQSPVLLGLANYSIGARERPERISNAPHIIYLPASPPPPPPSLEIAPEPELSFTFSLTDPFFLIFTGWCGWATVSVLIIAAVYGTRRQATAQPTELMEQNIDDTARGSADRHHLLYPGASAVSRSRWFLCGVVTEGIFNDLPSASSSSITAEALRAEADLNVSYGAEPAFEHPAIATPPSSSSSSSSCEVNISYGLEHAFEEPAPISRSQILSRVEDAKARLYERHFWLRAEMGVLERELADLRDQSARVKADVDERQWEYGFLTDDQLAASLPPFSPLFPPSIPTGVTTSSSVFSLSELASPEPKHTHGELSEAVDVLGEPVVGQQHGPAVAEVEAESSQTHTSAWSGLFSSLQPGEVLSVSQCAKAEKELELFMEGAAPEAEVRAASEAEVRAVRQHVFDRIALGRSNLLAAMVVLDGEQDKEEGRAERSFKKSRELEGFVEQVVFGVCNMYIQSSRVHTERASVHVRGEGASGVSLVETGAASALPSWFLLEINGPSKVSRSRWSLK
ncbi:hypothetical protein B0H13DRAFT_2542620 [Mycena leptocephala]|nr:hypothetical protein B0H13DRAFT_2542620 [Mycena leptocephala]